MRSYLRHVAGLMASLMFFGVEAGSRLSAEDDVVTVPASNSLQSLNEPLVAKRRGSFSEGSSQVDESLILRTKLENKLVHHLGKIEAECRLTAEQKWRLQLAGRGDILRLMTELQKIDEEYFNNTTKPWDGQFVLHIEVEKRVLVPATASFSDNSLFFKVLTKYLTGEQKERFEAFDQQERMQEIRATFNGLYRGGNTLSEEQLRSITQLYCDRYPEWRPLHFKSVSFGTAMLIADEMKGDLKPLLTDRQWQLTEDYIQQAKPLEPMLRSYRIWPIPASVTAEKPPTL